MAGTVALPDKTKGPNAGLIAKKDAKESAYVAKRNVDKVVLPNNVDSITIWFRLDGTGAPAVSGEIDSVTIEDLGKK